MRKMTNLGVVTCFPVLLGSLTGWEDAATLGDEGASQNITIASNLPGAAWTLARGGQAIGFVSAARGDG